MDTQPRIDTGARGGVGWVPVVGELQAGDKMLQDGRSPDKALCAFHEHRAHCSGILGVCHRERVSREVGRKKHLSPAPSSW